MSHKCNVQIKNNGDIRILYDNLNQNFDFLHMGDLHFIDYQGTDPLIKEFAQRRKFDRMKNPTERVTNWLSSLDNCRRESFVISSGDLIDFFDESSIKHASEVLSKIGLPFYFTPGNHDFQDIVIDSHNKLKVVDPIEQRNVQVEKKSTAFKKYFNHDLPEWKFEYQGIVFLGIDNSDYRIKAKSLELLRETEQSGKVYLLFYHIPIRGKELGREVKKRWPEDKMLMIEDENGKEMIEILKSSNYFMGSFAGHTHFNFHEKLGQSYQFVTKGGFELGVRRISLSS